MDRNTDNKLMARANTNKTMPADLIERTRNLVDIYQEIPLVVFPTLWRYRYDELFDATARGFDGLYGFFYEIASYIPVQLNEEYIICKADEPDSNALVDGFRVKRDRGCPVKPQSFIFDQDRLLLWGNARGHARLLDKKDEDIVLAKSPLEMALERNPDQIRNAVSLIRRTLKQYPDGLKIHELSEKVCIDKRLFNVVSIDELVSNYPELFYTVEGGNALTGELRVFDGFEKTYEEIGKQNLTEHMRAKGYEPELITVIACLAGLYQMTCILIRKSGDQGIRLSSWKKSLENNFDLNDKYLMMLFSYLSPPVIIFILSSFGLLKIESSPLWRNDLRIHLPRQYFDADDKILLLREEFKSIWKFSSDENYCLYHGPVTDSDYHSASHSPIVSDYCSDPDRNTSTAFVNDCKN